MVYERRMTMQESVEDLEIEIENEMKVGESQCSGRGKDVVARSHIEEMGRRRVLETMMGTDRIGVGQKGKWRS